MKKYSLRTGTPYRNILLLILLLFLSLPLPLSASPTDSLSYKIGQMIIVGFYPSSDFEDTVYYDIEYRNLGGVILMGYNLKNPSQITDLTANLQNSATTPLFIATDQEGGLVARLDENNGFTVTPTAYRLGTVLDNEDSTRKYAKEMAQWLSQSGINTNLAPVVDVNVNPSSPAIGHYGRSFSADPYKVFDHANWFISEFSDYNVISTLKHFPGHGSAEQDSHDGFTDITNTWSDMELTPYRELISAGYSDMVMTGHLYNAYLDSIYPASLSEKIITGLLRDSLEFQGLVISDAMSMRAISDNYTFEEAVVLAVNAGTDILLYTGDEYDNASRVAEIIRIIRKNINDGVISEARIDESYDRIMALKAGINTAIAASDPALPDIYQLHAYPNPFNASTRISFHIDQEMNETVQIRIYSSLGQLVQILYVSVHGTGKYEVFWNGTAMNGNPLPSGTYLYVVDLYNTLLSGKMTLLK